MAHGVSREGAIGILDQCSWDANLAINNFMDTHHPNKKSKLLAIMPSKSLHLSEDEKTPTVPIPLMGSPVAIPQMPLSSQEKEKLKGKAVVDQSSTMKTSPASLEKLQS